MPLHSLMCLCILYHKLYSLLTKEENMLPVKRNVIDISCRTSAESLNLNDFIPKAECSDIEC